MSARIAAVRLGRTESGDVVLAEDPRSAFLLAAEGGAIPAGFEVPDEWIVGSSVAVVDDEPANDAPAEDVPAEDATSDGDADDVAPASDAPAEDAPEAAPKGAKGRKKTW